MGSNPDHEAPSFAWDVTLPERGAYSSLSAVKPKAVVAFGYDSTSEHVEVPVAVGKRLSKLREQEELDPCSPPELTSAMEDACLRCAYERLRRLVDRRDYSCKEASEKLRLDGYPNSTIEQSIEAAIMARLLDDDRYADIFIRSKLHQGWGPKRIEMELSSRGIEPSAVRGWPELYLGDKDDFERALEVASTKRLSGKNPYAKLVRFLCARGFSTNVSMSVARELCSAEEGQLQ